MKLMLNGPQALTIFTIAKDEQVPASAKTSSFATPQGYYCTETNEEKLENLFNVFTIKIHKDYLEDTKWYIDRLNDPSSGKAVPADVLTKRAFAREEINRCEEALNINVSE
jgi:hypothetical protein